MHLVRVLLAAIPIVAACDDTVGGLEPVGGDQPSQAELERFTRRLHLDLTGDTPSDAYVADATVRLTDAGNTAAARRELAEELVAGDLFAALYVAELENRTFGGETADARYGLLCGVVRGDDPACQACGAPTSGDPCGDCDCAFLTEMRAERAALFTAADDLASGDPTSSLERRFAEATPLRALSSPEGAAAALFDAFLGHTPQDEEQRNAAAMISGALLPGSPAGLLFHRHGADFADLLDIVFESEVYREAIVGATFERYLGRRPTAQELGHFAASLDPDAPDARTVVLPVVSSREYFEQ